jgi:hypothetical protein
MAKMSEESAAAGKKFLEENAKKAGVVDNRFGLAVRSGQESRWRSAKAD